MSKFDDVLSKLPSVTSIIYEGRAISRDKKHIHLAVSSGVIAIPLDAIEKATVLAGDTNDILTVVVRDPYSVVQLRAASRAGFPWGGGRPPFGNAGDTFSQGRYVDSATASGGKADQTDDTNWVEIADDVWT